METKDIEIQQIHGVVSNNIGTNANLYATVSYIENVFAVRKVDIVISHERLVRGGDEEILKKIMNEEVMPVAKSIRKELDDRGFDVSPEENFNIIGYTDDISVTFKTSLKPIVKKESEPVMADQQEIILPTEDASVNDETDTSTITWA